MYLKKIIFILIVFATFLGSGAMLSNVQSREADQLLEEHGLSNNTRYFYTNKSESISDFLKYLNKTYPKTHLQLHLDNRELTNQVLVWANYQGITLPTQSGRYFSLDDFKGQVSFAVLGPDAVDDAVELQNNKYIVFGKRYYSVIGIFKNFHQKEQEKYYLTTGVDQPTAKGSIRDYRIVIDSTNKSVIKKIAKHYGSKLHVPQFVTTHQHHRFSVLKDISGIILMWVISIIANALIAFMQWRQVRRTHLSGNLLRNWLLNRSVRLILIEVVSAIIAYVFLRMHAFINKPEHLAFVLIISWIVATVSYVASFVILHNKEKRKNA